MSRTLQEILRFAVVGAANTVVTGGIFYALAGVMDSSVAYTIAFASGICFSAAVTPRFVFLSRPQMTQRVAFAAWYLLVYLVGLAMVHVLGDILALSRIGVVVITVGATAGLSFMGARWLFSNQVDRGRS